MEKIRTGKQRTTEKCTIYEDAHENAAFPGEKKNVPFLLLLSMNEFIENCAADVCSLAECTRAISNTQKKNNSWMSNPLNIFG